MGRDFRLFFNVTIMMYNMLDYAFLYLVLKLLCIRIVAKKKFYYHAQMVTICYLIKFVHLVHLISLLRATNV